MLQKSYPSWGSVVRDRAMDKYLLANWPLPHQHPKIPFRVQARRACLPLQHCGSGFSRGSMASLAAVFCRSILRCTNAWMKDVINEGRLFCSNLKLRHWQKRFIAYVEHHDNDRVIFWVFSTRGNNGKSKLIKHLCAADGRR